MALSSKLDRYLTISTIGSGGMATVVLAEDTVLGRRVALKRITAPGDIRGLSRLRREALIGASLSHPNLVSVYDVVAAEDDQVIVMEYVAGETLSDALSREGKLPVPEALRVLEGVGAALDAIHRQGIVHRDVKPANVLLGAHGTVKLADLGIASVPDLTRITTTGAVLGSWRYMAPEQLENEPSTAAIDIYALSAVAFEVLSGRKARGEPNPLALAHAISTRPPPDLREPWPGAPAEAAELLIRGMARDPGKRPSSAGELTGRLRSALVPEPTLPVAVPPAVRDPAADAVPPPMRFVPAPKPPLRRARPREVNGRPRVQPRPSSPPASQRRRSRHGPLAAALLALVAVAVLSAVILSGGGSRTGAQNRASVGHRSPAAAKQSHPGAPASTTGSGEGGNSGRAPNSRAAAPAAGAAAPSTGPTSPSASASPVAAVPARAAGSPISSVESFYGLAASHRYAEAWALADPTFRNQLAGYESFQAGQAGDISINFNSARIVSQSSNTATVGVSTTSVRGDGTKHCAGIVNLERGSGSGGWLLHLIDINCS